MFPINFQRQKHKFHYVGEGNVIQHIVQNSVNFEENPYNYILMFCKVAIWLVLNHILSIHWLRFEMKQDIDIIDIEALKADEPVSGVACTWHDHIADITSKTWKRINVFWSLMFKLDRKTLETIYFSFIRPTLEYSDVVWDNCNCDEKYRIEQIQIEAALIVTGATRSCSRSKLLEDTGWISPRKKKIQPQITYLF